MSYKIALAFLFSIAVTVLHGEEKTKDYYKEYPFGEETRWAKKSDRLATGRWWEFSGKVQKHANKNVDWFKRIPREEALAFALYTHDHGVLKMSAQCFPLKEHEPKEVTLSLLQDNEWKIVQQQDIVYPGWSAHFRVEQWDNTRDIAYRLTLGDLSSFEGLIRKDPVDQDTIVVASLNCNSPNSKEFDTRDHIVTKLKQQNPDLLFFAGDQNYTHEEATFGWLQFGVQFADIMKDRPTVCLVDDHDVGHGNLWGEGGKASAGTKGATDGGYMYPAEFVKMVERQQCWSLPDPFDPTPIKQGIGVYYTDVNVGGVSFALLEDRKFKSAPLGNIPLMGRRPDHIKDPNYDRDAVDLEGLELLGERQLSFLKAWSKDWAGVEMKVVLSQTAFCGAVHRHGNPKNRLLADLDCNGWPQSGRNRALRAIRKAQAAHLCGDQHLAVALQHGIDGYRDGPYAFMAPAINNSYYGRWWRPDGDKVGGGQPVGGPNPWVGDYLDGFGNRMTMLAYANPESSLQVSRPTHRGDGYGIVRFHKSSRQLTFECWPKYADLSKGDESQYPGWPIRLSSKQNDGRTIIGHLKTVDLPFENAVVELTNEDSGEMVYCFRTTGKSFRAHVYKDASYTLKCGRSGGEQVLLKSARLERVSCD